MTDQTEKNYASYEEFWPFYLSQHAKRATRRYHIGGTLIGLLFIVIGLLSFQPIWLLLAPFVGYGFAWIAHRFIEHNRPATFTYPMWSLRGDFHMLALWLTGRLEAEIAKHHISE